MENRRHFLKTGLLAAGALSTAHLGATDFLLPGDEKFSLPALPYKFDALEPHIDAMTMEIHHDRHHKAYVDKLNEAIVKENATGIEIEKVLKTVSKYSATIRNNGGGHYNHSLFWMLMKPGGANSPQGLLADAIKSSFNNFDEFKGRFNDTAKSRFGSGWAWLVVNAEKKLEVGSTPNQDNPLMDIAELKGIPILCLDVWEHSYYLKYQNKRADYINAWWNVVNWEKAAELFAKEQ